MKTKSFNSTRIAQSIEHTLLRPTATEADVRVLCDEAKKYQFGAVCVHPCFCSLAKKLLAKSSVKVVSVCGFPLGVVPTFLKVAEFDYLLTQGVDEIDFVINLSWLKEGRWDLILQEMKLLKAKAKQHPLKVIIETFLLTDEEKRRACHIAMEAGIDFVKTSTGFAGGGATPEDVKLLVQTVQGKAEVKASGGIKTLETAELLLSEGASRLGTSNGVQIMQGFGDGADY